MKTQAVPSYAGKGCGELIHSAIGMKFTIMPIIKRARELHLTDFRPLFFQGSEVLETELGVKLGEHV